MLELEWRLIAELGLVRARLGRDLAFRRPLTAHVSFRGMAICACRSRRRPFALPGYGDTEKSGAAEQSPPPQCNIWNMIRSELDLDHVPGANMNG